MVAPLLQVLDVLGERAGADSELTNRPPRPRLPLFDQLRFVGRTGQARGNKLFHKCEQHGFRADGSGPESGSGTAFEGSIFPEARRQRKAPGSRPDHRGQRGPAPSPACGPCYICTTPLAGSCIERVLGFHRLRADTGFRRLLAGVLGPATTRGTGKLTTRGRLGRKNSAVWQSTKDIGLNRPSWLGRGKNDVSNHTCPGNSKDRSRRSGSQRS
jgi:hypothetical protein